MNNRAKSLNWWRNLSVDIKITLGQMYFPDKSYAEISTSSQRIELIYDKRMEAEKKTLKFHTPVDK